MEKKYILLLVVIVFAIFMFTGNRNVDQNVSIGSCSASYSTAPTFVTSDLCVNGTSCVAQPGDMQNNAIVDVLLCACEQAKDNNYQDDHLNDRIRNVTYEFFGYNTNAQEFCEQPVLLVRRPYG